MAFEYVDTTFSTKNFHPLGTPTFSSQNYENTVEVIVASPHRYKFHGFYLALLPWRCKAEDLIQI